MTEHVLSALAKHRAELAGEADALRARLAAITADISHVDAVIRQFDPDYDLGRIRPKRPRGPDVAKRGERSWAILAVLREAGGPLTVAEITRRVLARDGQDDGDRNAMPRLAKRIGMTLWRQAQRGTVRSEQGPSQLMVWDVVR